MNVACGSVNNSLLTSFNFSFTAMSFPTLLDAKVRRHFRTVYSFVVYAACKLCLFFSGY